MLQAVSAGRKWLRPIGLDYFFSMCLGLRLAEGRGLIQAGAVAQLGERLICIQEVAGSIPTSSTSFLKPGL